MGDNDIHRLKRQMKQLKHRQSYLENKPHQTSWAKSEIEALKEALSLMEEKLDRLITNL
jgi:hypothetical protein